MPPRTTPSISRHHFARMLSSHRGFGASPLSSAAVFRRVRAPAKEVCGRLSPSNANPACGHKEVPRSTGHIVVTTGYSDQQGSKSRQKLCDSASNGTGQYQNGSLNLLTPYREQPRSTRIVVAYPRPAFSATERTNYAPTSFDQQVKVSQGHTSYKNKEN